MTVTTVAPNSPCDVVNLSEADAGSSIEAGNNRGVIAGLKVDHDR